MHEHKLITCQNCGSTHTLNWGNDLCYKCMKDKFKTAVEDALHQKSHINDAFYNAYPEEGAEINLQGYVLKEQWEYQTPYCFKCKTGKKHTVMEHAELVANRVATIYQLEENAKKSKEKGEIQMDNWHLPSSKRCLLCKEEIPHTSPEHYLCVEKYDLKGLGSDTYSGQIEPNSINFPETDKPVMSEIRPFTLADIVEVEKRRLSSRLTKQIEEINEAGPWDSYNIDAPAKASGHVQWEHKFDTEQAKERYYYYDKDGEEKEKHEMWKKYEWANAASSKYWSSMMLKGKGSTAW